VSRYLNEIDIADTGHYHEPADLDLIFQKRNVWEISTRKFQGSTFGEIKWSEIKHHFNLGHMNFQSEPDDNPGEPNDPVVEPVVEEWQMLPEEKPRCDEETMRSLLGRLAKWRCDSYDEHVNVGMAINNNFPDDEIKAFQIWDEWCKTSEKYQEKGQSKKWKTFSKKKCDKPLTYRSIVRWADIDDPQNELEYLFKNSGEDAMVRKMNEEICYRGQFSDIVHIYIPEDRTYECKKEPQMKMHYRTKKFKIKPDDTQAINPFTLWAESPVRKAVTKIDFDPTGRMKDIFNLWNGYEISEGVENGSSQALCDHIKKVWCRDNDRHYEYVMNWFAWILQRPERKVGVMICVKSRQGTGKGIVVSVMKSIMNGERYNGPMSQLSNTDSVIKWSDGIEGKCLINFDEAFWGGSKELEGVVKNLVTEPHQQIRKKNEKPYSIRNTTAFLVTTNNEHFVGMTYDDRRYFCLDANSDFTDAMQKADKRAYFRNIVKCEKGLDPHIDVVNDFAFRLYNRDISDFDPEDYDRTALAQSQIKLGWCSVTRWWHTVLEDCMWRNGEGGYMDSCEWDELPGDIDADGYRCVSKRWIYECYEKTKLHGYRGHHETYQVFCGTTSGLFKDALPETRRGPRNAVRKMYMIHNDIKVLQDGFNKTQRCNEFQ
jgi:hypothetical protein